MSILKEKVELQQVIQELRDERRNIKSTVNTPAKSQIIQTLPDKTPNSQSTGKAPPITTETEKQNLTTQYFLSHSRASTSTHPSEMPQTATELTGQPLYMQQTNNAENIATQVPYTLTPPVVMNYTQQATHAHHNQAQMTPMQYTLTSAQKPTQAPIGSHIQTHKTQTQHIPHAAQVPHIQTHRTQTQHIPHATQAPHIQTHRTQAQHTQHHQASHIQTHRTQTQHIPHATQAPHTQTHRTQNTTHTTCNTSTPHPDTQNTNTTHTTSSSIPHPDTQNTNTTHTTSSSTPHPDTQNTSSTHTTSSSIPHPDTQNTNTTHTTCSTSTPHPDTQNTNTTHTICNTSTPHPDTQNTSSTHTNRCTPKPDTQNQQATPMASSSQHEHTISVASINIQNIKSNIPYLHTLLEEHDLVCIQEHWLFNYEQNWISNNIKNLKVHIKSVDDDDPISHAQKIRGYGGIAIIGNNQQINDSLKELPDGNTRIQVLELKSNDIRVAIVNCYMPCRNSRTGLTDYDEALDTLGEILIKYRETHNIILAGDFNASFTRTPENSHDKKLRQFFKEHNIQQANTNTNTFHHHNGKDKAQIDYIIPIPSTTNQNKFKTLHTQIHPAHPLNTSDHTAVTTKFAIHANKSPETNTNLTNTKPEKSFMKPRWTKCDELLYRNTVEHLLKESNIDPNTESNVLLGLEISKLETILLKATENAIEGHKTHASAIKPKGRGKWNSEIAEASKHSKSIHKKIKESGTNNIELLQEQKKAKRRLRQLQRQQAYTEREALYREIMTAEKEDQQLFYKLVNKQRKYQQQATNTIILEGIEMNTHEEILQGWKVHFQKLATPEDNSNTERDFEDLVMLNDLLIQQICRDVNEPILPVTHEEVREAIKHLKKNKAPDAYGITAEHVQMAKESLVPIITAMINSTIQQGALPQHLKEGVLTPVLKKGKDQKIPSNYRGITVTTNPTCSPMVQISRRQRPMLQTYLINFIPNCLAIYLIVRPMTP